MILFHFITLFYFIVLESHVLRFIEFLRTLVKTSTVIGVIVAVTAAVLLVVGCVLVTQNGLFACRYSILV